MVKIKPPFVRNPYNYDTNEASDESALKCEDKSLAQQHFKDECDINWLVERYLVKGEPIPITMPPLQGDFNNIPTMQEALDLVVKARESFMQLPAKARARFNNNAVEFVDFCSNEANRDEMRTLGLWSPEAVAAWEAEASRKAQEAELNAKDAAEYRASKKVDPTKGTT